MENEGLGSLLWFLIWGGLFYFMMRSGGCGMHGDGGHGHGSKGGGGLKPGKTVDPVCGMEVDMTDETIIQRYSGQIYYFCSRKCVENFNRDPMTYLGPEGPDSHEKQEKHGGCH